MTLYAETSAILRWLLGAPDGELVRAALAAAEVIFTSCVTELETTRVLSRMLADGTLDERSEALARALFLRAVAHWRVVGIIEPIASRTGAAFPVEPVRTLDAIHLATALFARRLAPELRMLTTDRRVGSNCAALGIDVVPAAGQMG